MTFTHYFVHFSRLFADGSVEHSSLNCNTEAGMNEFKASLDAGAHDSGRLRNGKAFMVTDVRTEVKTRTEKELLAEMWSKA
jgi:hypothetical protein